MTPVTPEEARNTAIADLLNALRVLTDTPRKYTVEFTAWKSGDDVVVDGVSVKMRAG